MAKTKPKAKLRKLTTAETIDLLERLPQSVAAWLLGMVPRVLRDCPTCPRNPDGTYDGQEAVRWHVGEHPRGPGPLGAEPDPLMLGTGSPALEEYRRHRAGLAELDLNERRGNLVPVDDFASWWQAEVAAPVRRAVEVLQRLGPTDGPTAAGIIRQALQRAEAAVEKRTGDHDDA